MHLTQKLSLITNVKALLEQAQTLCMLDVAAADTGNKFWVDVPKLVHTISNCCYHLASAQHTMPISLDDHNASYKCLPSCLSPSFSRRLCSWNVCTVGLAMADGAATKINTTPFGVRTEVLWCHWLLQPQHLACQVAQERGCQYIHVRARKTMSTYSSGLL